MSYNIRIIRHRVNDLDLLAQTHSDFGVEIDLRTFQSQIVVQHDWRKNGVSFESYLEQFNHKFIILNVKEDGLEDAILHLLQKRGISQDNFFFLDQSGPTQVKFLKSSLPTAVRISDYELPQVRTLDFQIPWIWVDSFTGRWNHLDTALKCARLWNSRLCFISPELQGRNSFAERSNLKNILFELSLTNDVSICTKFPEFWSVR